jgi:hypothetical protein
MKAFKSALASTAVVLAFVVAGCASVAPFESGDILTQMAQSSQSGGD